MMAADLRQVLAIYRDLRSRTILQPRTLATSPVTLKTKKAMSRSEAGYAITVLLAINGIAAVDDGEKFTQLVPVETVQAVTWKEVELRAPKADAQSPLFYPKEIPKSPPGPPAPAVKRLGELYTRLFHNQPPWTPKPVDQLVAVYAELTDQHATPSKSWGQMPVIFDIATPVTKAELLYAIETTLRLNALAIGKVDGSHIAAVTLREVRSEKANTGRSDKP